MKKTLLTILVIWCFIFVPLTSYALTGVASKITKLSTGPMLTISGRHAPASEVVIVNGSREVVAAALVEASGDFQFSFRADASETNQLEVFALDQASQTNSIPVLTGSEVLLPPSIVENPEAPQNKNNLSVGGYTYPGAVLTLNVISDQGELLDTVLETADEDGAWLSQISQLEPGRYSLSATSKVSSLTSQSSVILEIKIDPGNVLVNALPKPVSNAVDSVGNVVENVAKKVLPAPITTAVEGVAPQAKQVGDTVAPVASASLFTQLLFASREIIYFILQGGISLFQYFGFLRKRQSWGVVYDAITKQPIMLATVRLYAVPQTVGAIKKLIETDVSSKAGIFSFEPAPGNYEIRVSKPGYSFPSGIIQSVSDGEYAHVYHGERVHLDREIETIDVSIPLDPENIQSLNLKTRIVLFVRQRLYLFTLSMLGLGFLMSLITVIAGERGINVIILLFYLAVLAGQWLTYRRKRRAWGQVVGTKDDPMAGIQLNLIDPQFNKLVQRRVTDDRGKYQFLVPHGRYLIQVETSGVRIVTGLKDTYQGQEIWVEGDKPKLIAVKIVVEEY